MYVQDMNVSPGDVIVAPPHMQDPRFARTVLMVTHETNHGHFALCLNRPTEHTVNDISDEVGIELYPDCPMYWGGPVNPQTVWMLHSNEWCIDQTINIDEHWSMTSNRSMFHEIAHGNVPERFRVSFGFAGWAQGQLERELQGEPPLDHKSSWLIWRNPDPDLLIDTAPQDLWRVATEHCAQQWAQGVFI